MYTIREKDTFTVIRGEKRDQSIISKKFKIEFMVKEFLRKDNESPTQYEKYFWT